MIFPLGKLQRGIRRRLARMIMPRELPNGSPENWFYPQQPSCQIPNLGYLLRKFLGERDDGHYVEVGAYDGVFASNTWGLAERGWQGLLIEPIPHLAEKCRRNYAHLERVQVIQLAIGNLNGEIVLHLAGTLTTANQEAYAEYAEIEWARNFLTKGRIAVECRTLDWVLDEHSIPRGFDLLVVDVEGFETEVFAGFDWSQWRPKMLIVELADTHPDLAATESEDAALSWSLVSAGYIIAYKDAINTVFVRCDIWNRAFGLV